MRPPACAAGWVPAHTIRHAKIAGGWVLLDLRKGKYRVLDPVASDFWDVIIEDGRDETELAGLARKYDVDLARVSHDYSAFVKTCLSECLIEAEGREPQTATIAPKGSVRRTIPAFLLALHSMIATAWWLSYRGFPATYREYGRLRRGRDASDSAFYLRRFAIAENFFLASRGTNDCLVRSLSLFRFLNAVGVCASHVIGVRRFPFAAHAWVEVEGRVAQQDNVHDYAPLARM